MVACEICGGEREFTPQGLSGHKRWVHGSQSPNPGGHAPSVNREELVEKLKRSAKKYGAAYPVLLDARGKLIDGSHRLEASKKWPKIKVDWIKDDYDLMAFRAQIHNIEREIAEKERADEFKTMAEILEKRGIETKKEQAERIAEDTGFSKSYVLRLIAEPTSTTPAVEHRLYAH